MKLLRYSRDGVESIGALCEKGVVDIGSGWGGANRLRSIAEILEGGQGCLERVRELCRKAKDAAAVEGVRFLAPMERCGKVLALAGNYSEHIKEASLERGFALGMSEAVRERTVPRPFMKPGTTIIGPGDEIPWPEYSEQIDYEIELGVVIGRRAKCVGAEAALDYVGGYVIVNDVSARSVTFRKGRQERSWDEFYDWLGGKWADGFCPVGPYVVTRDEVGDVQNLEMELRVNGAVRQKANTSQMIYPVAEVVSFLSYMMTLEAGDVIATGTPAGVGAATGEFLEEDDMIECEIEGLGILTNTMGHRPVKFYEPLG